MENQAPLSDHYYQLLRQLQEIDFVLVELQLYLDTHPDDMNALRQYNDFALKRQAVSCEFEKHYGPLMQFGHSYSAYPFQWVNTPWPWQV